MFWSDESIQEDKKYILNYAKSIEEVYAAIDEQYKRLMAIDWETCLQEKQNKLETFLNEVVACDRCQRPFFRYELKDANYKPEINMLWISSFCLDCRKAIYLEKHPFCVMCGEQYSKEYTAHRNDYFCPNCRTDQRAKEPARVISHNNRAKELGVVATLTVKEWISTLQHFKWRCAYCSNLYKCLEHYIPLPHEGTTQSNCLPSCNKCNHIKKDKLPEEFEPLFPSENIRRIKEYQASLIKNAKSA